MLRPEAFLYETDPAKQNLEWANKVVTRRRWDWRPVVDDAYYKKMKSILLSMQNLDETVKKYFTDTEFVENTLFKPLPIMEKPRNIIIDQARETGIKPYIEAVDPTAKIDKQQDLFRLKTMARHIADVNQVRSSVGVNTPAVIRDKDFNGNVPEFVKMGLDPQNESDVKFFFDTHYKLNYEGYAQQTVMALIGVNQAEKDIPRYVNDIMAVKIICKQDFISKMTGQIITKYLQPNQVYVIWGNNRDATDAAVRGWEYPITVREFFDLAGRDFDFEKDWVYLVRAINYGSGQKFDGFVRGDRQYVLNNTLGTPDQAATQPPVAEIEPNLMNFEDCYNYKVYFGYMEWEQPTTHAEKFNPETYQRFTVSNDFQPTKKSPYIKEEWNYFVEKQTNYLVSGPTSQKLVGYGNMYMHQTKGANDEYACGSISIIREEGMSAVASVENYIILANYAYYKMLWAIHRSKPDVWDWSYDSIRDIAMKMDQQINTGQATNGQKPSGTFGDALNKLIEKFDKNLIMMHSIPHLNGQPVGGGGLPHQKIPGNLDQLAVQLREMVLEWAERQVEDKLGLAGIANAQAPQERAGLKLNQLYMRQSKAATGYIPRMIDMSFRHTADVMLRYIQDILNFPDTVAYKYLQNLIGNDAIEALSSVGDDAAPHRYAIFATSYSNAPEKQDQLADAQLAFQKGLITFAEYSLLKLIDDPRVAAKQSAYFQERGEKRKEQQVKQANEFAKAMQDQKINAEYELEKMKAQAKILDARIRANGFIYQADKMYQGKVDSAAAAGANATSLQDKKLEDRKEEMQDKATIELQQSLLSGK